MPLSRSRIRWVDTLPPGYGVAAIDPPNPPDPRCICGRRWSDHRTSTDCPNPECCDGWVGYEDDPDNPLRDCGVCHGLARVPLASGDGYEDCWEFSEADEVDEVDE